MTENQPSAWDPRSPTVLEDQIAAYDELRGRCPVAHSDFLGWSVLRHDDVVRALDDPQTFSNAVPHRLTVPNEMDPPEHTEFRRINDRYFTPDLMDAFEPSCRRIATDLVDDLPRGVPTDLMAELAEVFALRVQNAFLGWPATLAQDRPAMSAIAVEFDGYIRDLLTTRRQAGDAAPDDLTTRLLGERVWGRPMTDDELVSLLRNWTVGELSTISASVGILAHHLAVHPTTQQLLRDDPALIGAQQLLGRGVHREVVREDPDARRDRAQLTNGPVAQQADELVVGHRAVPDPLTEQAGGQIVQCGIARLSARGQQVADEAVELDGDGRHRRPVLRERGRAVLGRPAPQRLLELGRPAEERVLHP